MAEKQSILGRITQLAKANINALLDRAEDPQKMLDQLIRDYTNSIADAESAVAQTIGNLRLAEKDHAEDVAAAEDWGRKAQAASTKADQLRAAGDTAGADKWDNLAKVAIGKQIQFEGEAKESAPMIASQTEVVEKLKAGLNQMKEKLSDLKVRRDQLVARQKSAQAQAQVTDAISSINVLDPTSELSRFEDKVRRQEAMAQGKTELAASSLDAQFAELETDASQIEVEARLAALKNKDACALRPMGRRRAHGLDPALVRGACSLNQGALPQGGSARAMPWRGPTSAPVAVAGTGGADPSAGRRTPTAPAKLPSEEGQGVEVVDVDDAEPGQPHLEGVDVVLEVDDLEAPVDQVVQLGGEELPEAHHADPAPRVEEGLDLRDEVGVVAGQDHRSALEFDDRVHGALQADVHDLHVLGARQRDDRVVHRRERLDEPHRQVPRRAVEEEQALRALPPLVVRPLQDAVPAGPLLGVRAPVQH